MDNTRRAKIHTLTKLIALAAIVAASANASAQLPSGSGIPDPGSGGAALPVRKNSPVAKVTIEQAKVGKQRFVQIFVEFNSPTERCPTIARTIRETIAEWDNSSHLYTFNRPESRNDGKVWSLAIDPVKMNGKWVGGNAPRLRGMERELGGGWKFSWDGKASDDEIKAAKELAELIDE